jgi:phosphoenolpyruvate carboxykinase (ATP)
MNYFLLNTGGVGEGERYKEITVDHTMAILDSLLRGGLEDWITSPTNFEVPKAIRMLDDIYLHPEKLYSTAGFEERQAKLNRFRSEAIKNIGSTLHPKISHVFNFNEKLS